MRGAWRLGREGCRGAQGADAAERLEGAAPPRTDVAAAGLRRPGEERGEADRVGRGGNGRWGKTDSHVRQLFQNVPL